MKSFRLIVHQKTFSEDDLVINQKDYAKAKKNDIMEIYHADDENQKKTKKNDSDEEYPHLLLQIKTFRDDLMQARETISVEQSIATAFGLQTYKNVVVRLVNPDDVALDSIELTFKDQYLGRSEMWRLKNSLINTCVYINKKLEFCGGSIRCQVYEMWAKGEKVACGVINHETKLVFRSSTAMVYIFLQMSCEMWDFDIYGNLYFEKAINGFLADLFAKWKKNGSNHEVTIVMFSRTFYKASHLEEFPEQMRECLQKDSKGKYYEDFYRVAVQNERFDDWSIILVTLRRIFQQYLKIVLEYHKRPNTTVPSAVNSSAAQGNFLEVLNMSLNVFEKHYLDRSFDRTGQLSVVITPGVGVFEVDRELTNITKQRVIDGGVGSDLVCVGEQPLHAVPLLKFRNKGTILNVPDDYSMPHWINLSFYTTNKKFGYSSFTPRIKVPPPLTEREVKKLKRLTKTTLVSEEDGIHNSFFDYDAFDAAIFQTINPHHAQDNLPMQQMISSKNPNFFTRSSLNSLEFAHTNRGMTRNLSDPEIIQHKNEVNTRSKPIAIPPGGSNFLASPPLEDKDFSPPVRMVVGSEGSPPHESRALINPFDPSHVTVKLTSNRRRWTHIFPKGPTGVLIQQHHYQAVPKKSADANSEVVKQDRVAMPINKVIVVTSAVQEYCKKKPFHNNPTTNARLSVKHSSKSLTLLWGATGEQEWTPALTTGVDWKSLTIPACLPITTDYFPDKKTLNTDYLVSLYSLVPDSVYADFAQQRTSYKKPLTTDEVFRELISQRLSQGFQIIFLNEDDSSGSKNINQYPRNSVLKKGLKENDETHFLSVGRVFHKIALAGNTISVTRYRPRHPHPGFRYQYRYRFHAPKHENYEDSFAIFTTEKLEHYNWNYLDHYVCTGGYTTDFVLVDALKYWRLKIYFLTINHPDTKKIIDGSNRCDIYSWTQNDDRMQATEGFLRFAETAINKIKKNITVSKKPRNTSRLSEKATSTSLSNALPGCSLLGQDSSVSEIIEAMKHPSHGLSFVTSQHGLPNYTFVTADAINWLIACMEKITKIEEGMEVLEKLFQENLIRHASGDYTKKLVYGFSLFYILPERDEKDPQVTGDLESFETDFFEVEIKPPLNWGTSQIPQFLSNDVNLEYFGSDNEEPEYKRMRLETDVMNKSDRTEWGHVKYQTVFVADRAYELCIEWLTSSGSIIGELLFGWHRKAQSCGLQMIPIPHDPFSLPSSGTTDPLRAPIFVPLNIECLETDDIFKEYCKDDWEVKLFLLKEAIIQRFGFLHSISETVENTSTKEYQYVHATGSMFIMISSSACKPERSKSINLAGTRHSTNRYSVHADIMPSPHEAYITRHVSSQSQLERHSRNIGFLWAWNHMISRRWRTNQGVDTVFQLKILKDFRDFCNNCENRLIHFWKDSCDSTL